jgi:hypothetical protein
MNVETIFSKFRKEDYVVVDMSNKLDLGLAKIALEIMSASSFGKRPVYLKFKDKDYYQEQWTKQGNGSSLIYKLMRNGYDVSFSTAPDFDGTYFILHKHKK